MLSGSDGTWANDSSLQPSILFHNVGVGLSAFTAAIIRLKTKMCWPCTEFWGNRNRAVAFSVEGLSQRFIVSRSLASPRPFNHFSEEDWQVKLFKAKLWGCVKNTDSKEGIWGGSLEEVTFYLVLNR